MKIGGLELKPYAAKKPVSITSTGKLVPPADVLARPSLGEPSLLAMGTEHQLKLALQRYALEPDFKILVFGLGILTKDDVIEHLKDQSDLGKVLLHAEMMYLNEFLVALTSGAGPEPFPKIPKTPLPKIPDWKVKGKYLWMKLPTRAVFAENTTDYVTTPFAQYRIKNVHPVFAARGFVNVVFTGTNDVRANFAPAAKNGLVVYLSGIGHGAYDRFTGHMNSALLKVGDYDPAEVKDKSMHFLSCQTAKTLGPDTIAKGARSYGGYVENFILQWDDPSTPAKNEFELFARSDSTWDIMMANGATALQAYEGTVQAFNAAISQVPNTVAATYLTLDRDRLKMHGDPAAKIMPYRLVKVWVPLRQLAAQDALVAVAEEE